MFPILALAAAVPVLASDTAFACTPTRLWVGNGPVRCAKEPRLRIAVIVAQEHDGA